MLSARIRFEKKTCLFSYTFMHIGERKETDQKEKKHPYICEAMLGLT